MQPVAGNLIPNRTVQERNLLTADPQGPFPIETARHVENRFKFRLSSHFFQVSVPPLPVESRGLIIGKRSRANFVLASRAFLRQTEEET